MSKSSDNTCGKHRPGWGPGVGRHRLPCVLSEGHDGNEHENAFGERWEGSNEPADDAPKAPVRLRRLPFNGPEGKPAYVPADNPNGFLARIADGIEADQLGTGREVLKLSREMLAAEEGLAPDECRYVLMRLSECLADALNIAEARGERL